MTTDHQPPPYYQRWGGFPRQDFIPEGARDAVSRLLDLRVKLADAREDEAAKRAAIAKADQASVDATIQALVRGKTASVDPKPVSDAQLAHYRAVTALRALNGAIEIAEREVADAYARHAAEAHRLASEAVETARATYRESIEAVAQARRDYHDALDTLRFAGLAVLPLTSNKRDPAVNHVGQRVGDSPEELGKLRREVDPPVVKAPTDLASTTFSGRG